MTTKEAVEKLVHELNADPHYRYGWQANIAMAFYDEYRKRTKNGEVSNVELHDISNIAANNFLNILTSKG